jgi:hypothetical protein
VTELRRCAQCERPLPATATDRRRYCSVQCRGRSYYRRNPPPNAYPSASPRVRLHWRGPEGCPPECPGVVAPYTSSEAVPVGREGIAPYG